MTGALVQSRRNIRVRAGTYALTLLADPLNARVLKELEYGKKLLLDLRGAVGSPPQTTMRGHLKLLTEMGVLERRAKNDFPGSVDYELRTPGHELLAVLEVLQTWLSKSPQGPHPFDGTAASNAIKALVQGWSSTIVRALAARRLSLTDLNRLISGLNYPTIERRLGAMREAGLIEACSRDGRGTPYAPSDWLRQAIAPLAASALWERRHAAAKALPIGRLDVEAAFLLAIPMLRLAPDISGHCRLTVEQRNEGGENRLAGVMIEVRDGAIVSCVTRLRGHADAWASGSPDSWLAAVIDGDTGRLEIGGNRQLVTTLTDGLYRHLFGAQRAA